MDGDRAITPNLGGRGQIIKGTTVYDAAGEQIGSVHSYDPDNNHLVVQRGLLVHHRVDVPADAIARVDADGVYLALYHDALPDERMATEQGRALGQDLNPDVGPADRAAPSP